MNKTKEECQEIFRQRGCQYMDNARFYPSLYIPSVEMPNYVIDIIVELPTTLQRMNAAAEFAEKHLAQGYNKKDGYLFCGTCGTACGTCECEGEDCNKCETSDKCIDRGTR